jgi:hypothetical protein
MVERGSAFLSSSAYGAASIVIMAKYLGKLLFSVMKMKTVRSVRWHKWTGKSRSKQVSG